MKTYKLNGQKIVTDLDRNKIYEISRPVISYPFTFTGSIRQIEQEFIVGSTNVPSFNPMLNHPIYNNAHIISQSEANVDPMGFAKFTRTYIEFLESEIIFPKTLTYTYPSMWIGYNMKKRDLEPQLDNEDPPVEIKPQGLRRNPLTINIPVEERIELIYVGDGVIDTQTHYTDIQVGSSITTQGFSWNVKSNEDGNASLERTNNEGEIIILNSNLGNLEYTFFNTEPDFTKIEPTYKFNITDNYQQWGSAIILDPNNPHSAEVDFIDFGTSPNTYTYLNSTKLKTPVPLETSTFEHLGGYVYMKKTLWGSLR